AGSSPAGATSARRRCPSRPLSTPPSPELEVPRLGPAPYAPAVIDIEREGDVAVVRWRDGEHRFNRASVDRWHEVLDELEATEGPLAVVIVGEGKFFSNGLDLDAFAADPEGAGAVVDDVHRLFGRLLLFPAYTVAALNGHTFAGGAMLACCADLRVMRQERGYW